jgi:NAD(P)-dependent dehydrogenase (short-subunit alcohol dehydrogenase family)
MQQSFAVVFGGTGVLGREVLRGLAEAEVPALFTFYRSDEAAQNLAKEFGHRSVLVNLAQPSAIRALFKDLDAEGIAPNIFIHCAARAKAKPLHELTDEDWNEVQQVNCQSAFVACQELSRRMVQPKQGNIVLVGALDRSQSLPMPVPFAATQGMLSAMTMALAKELGPQGILINMVALGILDGGLSNELSPKARADFLHFSALRRVGTPREAAEAILWLALENTYMSGKVMTVNGGI